MLTRVFLAAGVAALAIAAPAGAEKGKNESGKSQEQRGGGQQAKSGKQGGERAGKAREQRFEQSKHFAENSGKQRERAVERMQKAEKRVFKNQERFVEAREKQLEKVFKKEAKQVERITERNRDLARASDWDNDDRWDRGKRRGFIDDCPPGLWAKDNGCMPPGQARRLMGQPIATAARIASLSALPRAVQYLYPDTDDYYYRYGSGYAYRVDRNTNLINSLLPLIAGGLLPGQMFPTNYQSNSFVPSYFNAFYPDTQYVDYRYANGNVYGVDPYSGLIENVVPMYANGYGVGQALPAGYGYYNVPTQYRDLYANTPDQNYWYSPGAIYQVDPTTQLITSVASLLAPGLSIGQQLPQGFGTYNVPMAYRDTYYDTPNAAYRYNNGNIYQVNPTTQLVTAIVASILT